MRIIAARVALLLASVVFSLVVLEAGSRLVRFGPSGFSHWSNLPGQRMSYAEQTAPCSYAYDATLGWISPRDCSSAEYNFDADGFRRTPAAGPLAEPAVLATGSSFALGQEVADDQSWPAYLQALAGRKVINAGVSGYALDQTVLRTERLAARLKPALVVASFTPGDIRHAELKVAWSRPKPYFRVAGDGLELANVPVPGGPGKAASLPLAARLLGWSAAADLVVSRLGIQRGWYFDEVRAVPAGTGRTIGCLLMARLARIGVPVVVLAQYSRSYLKPGADRASPDQRAVREVLGCAERAGLVALDEDAWLRPAVEREGMDAMFRTDHHSPEGNRGVARFLMRELAARRLLSPPGDARTLDPRRDLSLQ